MGMKRAGGLAVMLLSMTLVSSVSTRPVAVARGEPHSEEREEAFQEREEAEREGEPGRGTSVTPTARAHCTPDDDTLRLAPLCPAPVSVAGTTRTPLRFDKVLIGVGGDTEASITNGPDHTLLACSHGGFDGASPVWASLDGGRTWKRADPTPNPIVSGDCDVAISRDGSWAVVFDTIASATVAVSRDRGKTWSISYAAAIPAGSVDRPWLVADGNTLVLAYSNSPGAYQPAIQIVTVSTDGGRTWGTPHVVNTFDLPSRPNAVMGRPVVHGRQILIPTMMFDSSQATASWLYLLSSDDRGQTWTRRLIRGPYQTAFHFPSLTRASNGTLYTTIPIGVVDGDMQLTVLASRDGRSWKQFTVARHVRFPGVVTSIWADARPDGSATLAWMAVTDPAFHDPISSILGTYPPSHRQVWAARVGPAGVIARAQPVSAPVPEESSYEFLIVDHDARGRAHIIAPLDTAPSCHRTSVEGRGRQCVYDFIER